VHYIGYFADNDTIFGSSYDDPDTKTGGTPSRIFVTLNSSESIPANFSGYSNTIDDQFVEGFIEGLVGIKSNESGMIGPLPPEKAYGVSPKIGDEINLTEIYGTTYVLGFLEVKENAPMPIDYVPFLGNGTTTLYTLREDWHYIGEIIDALYPTWTNATVVTAINETLIWMYTTPPDDLDEYFDWTSVDAASGEQIAYPDGKTKIISTDDTEIIISHDLDVGESITVTGLFGQQVAFTVESITSDTINTSYIVDQTTGDKGYQDFNRTTTIARNETRNITVPDIPAGLLEMQLFSFLRNSDPTFKLSFNDLSDKTVKFAVQIVDVYRPS
jgi:hypothetical protein